MKLHLPKGLRCAVMACLAVAGGFATTVGTGFIAGGAVMFVVSGGQAQAFVTVNTDDEWTDPDDWTVNEELVVEGGATLTISGAWSSVDRGNCNVLVRGGSNVVIGMNDGSLLKVSYLNIHATDGDVKDTFTINNGTVVVTGTVNSARIGHWPGSETAELNIKGGTLAVINADMCMGWDSKGGMNVSGGKAIVKGISLNRNDGVSGDCDGFLNIVAGEMYVGASGIYCGTGDGVLNISGGKLATYVDTMTIGAPVASTVSGTATIDTTKYTLDTNGYEVSASSAGAAISWQSALTVNAGADLTITGAGSVDFAKTVTGSGNITIGSDTTFAGGINVNAGAVEIAAGKTLTLGGTVEVDSGATFDATGAEVIIDDINWNGDVSFTTFELSLVNGRTTSKAEYYIYTGSSVSGLDSVKIGDSSYTVTAGKVTAPLTLSTNSTYLMNRPNLEADLIINNGVTVKAGAKGGLGTFNTADTSTRKIIVNEGGVLDINGYADQDYHVTLKGGTLANTVGKIEYTSVNYPKLTLEEKDSSVDTAKDTRFGLLNSKWEKTILNLNGKTLTKTGLGVFHLVNTTVVNTTATAGRIDVDGGTLEIVSWKGKAGASWTNETTVSATKNGILIFNVDGDSSLTMGSTLEIYSTVKKQGAGTVTIKGTIDVPTLRYLEFVGTEDGLTGGTDGYMTYTDGCYILIKKEGGTIDLKTTKTKDEKSTLSLNGDGHVVISGIKQDKIYRVYTQDVTVDGTGDTANAEGFIVGDATAIGTDATARTLVIQKDGTYSLTFNGQSTLDLGANIALSNQLIISPDATTIMRDGSGMTSDVSKAMWIQGDLKVADGAKASINWTDDIHLNHQSTDAKIYIGAGSTLNLSAPSLQFWSTGASIELAEGSTLNWSGGYLERASGNNGSGVSIKLGEGSTLNWQGTALSWGHGNNSVDDVAASSTLNIKSGTLSFNLHSSADTAKEYKGKIAFENDTTLRIFDGKMKFSGDLTFDGNVTLNSQTDMGVIFSGELVGDTETVVRLTHDVNNDNFGIQNATFSAANAFAGTWVVDGAWNLTAAHGQAFEHATVDLKGADSMLSLESQDGVVKLAALKGEAGSVTYGFGFYPQKLELATTGTAEFKGSIAAGVSIVMNGTGEQIIKSLETDRWPGGAQDITVNSGTLTITEATYCTDRTVHIAAGATLKTDLSLTGGPLAQLAATDFAGYLSVDATGGADGTSYASLGGGSLTLLKYAEGADPTAGLDLKIKGTETVGEQLTLLTGVGGLFVGTEASAGGLLGEVGDFFSLRNITGLPVAKNADTTSVDSWKERLSISDLYYDADEDKLYLSLAANQVMSDPIYWEPKAAQAGSGNWSGANWSDKNADDGEGEAASCIDPGVITIANPNVVFSGDGNATTPAEVTVDIDATVNNMTMENGNYAFKGVGRTLTIGGKLTVEKEATTDLTYVTNVKANSVDNAGSLTIGNIELTGGTLSQSSGSLIVGEVSGTGKVELTGGKLSTMGLNGTKELEVRVGNVSVSGYIGNATLSAPLTVEGGGILMLTGTMHLDTTERDFGGKQMSTYSTSTDISDAGETLDNGGNGYITRSEEYTVVTVKDNGWFSFFDVQWTVGKDKIAAEAQQDDTGAYTGKVRVDEDKNFSEFWVNSTVTHDENTSLHKDTKRYLLNGGSLNLNLPLGDKLTIATNNENNTAERKKSQINIADGELRKKQLSISEGTTVTLMGNGSYNVGSGTDLVAANGSQGTLKLGEDDPTTDVVEGWTGTVKTGALDNLGSAFNVSALGNANSKVSATSILATKLTAGTVGTLIIEKGVTLSGGATSTVNDLQVGTDLSLSDGAVLQTKALTVTGVTTVSSSTIEARSASLGGLIISGSGKMSVTAPTQEGITTFAKAGATDGALTLNGVVEYQVLSKTAQVTAKSLTNTELSVKIAPSLLKATADAATDKTQPIATLMTLETASSAAITLNDGSNVQNAYGEKYGYKLDWDTARKNLQLTAAANPNYVKQRNAGGTPNGMAGAAIMDDAFANNRIGSTGDLAAILAGVDAGTITDKDLAAVAGSSTATLGMALAGDVERQLRAIRNRTTTMGVNQCVVNEGMPYFNAWVNAEGNLGELDKDSTYAGYKLDSWGGTVGFDVDVNPSLTLGLAVTAMFGDMTVDGPDMLEGDMDTCYVSAFARYAARAWTHTFIGTVGTMDGSYERTVTHANGKYTTKGDTDGTAFGLMYEVSRTFAIDDDGDACWQPVFNVAYRHASVGGYKEEGKDAALKVDDQTLNTVTFGAGARLQAVVGENLYNRLSVLELRALAKLDAGDRSSEADVAFIGGRSAKVESAELGAFGVELGAGLSIPLGDEDSGTLFFDVSAELRSGYSNVNGTVGYRINF